MGKESAAYLIAYFRSGPMQTNKRESCTMHTAVMGCIGMS